MSSDLLGFVIIVTAFAASVLVLCFQWSVVAAILAGIIFAICVWLLFAILIIGLALLGAVLSN